MKLPRFLLMSVTLALAALACSLPTNAPTVVVETVIVVVTHAAPTVEVAALPSVTSVPEQPPAAASATPWPTNTPGPTNTPAPTYTPSASPTIIRTPTRTPTYNPNDYWTRGSPTPFVACPGALPSRLWAGGYAYVLPEPPIANIVRNGAGTSNREIGYIDPGMAMDVLEGPTCADGLVWWKVRSWAGDNLTGWTAEQDGKYYWLAPCPLGTECGMPMDG